MCYRSREEAQRWLEERALWNGDQARPLARTRAAGEGATRSRRAVHLGGTREPAVNNCLQVEKALKNSRGEDLQPSIEHD